MNKPNDYRICLFRTTWCAGLIAAAALSVPAAAVELSPQQIEFDTIDTSATIKVTHGGQPVKASAINSVKLWASGHDYDHMIEVSKADGAITVRPSDMLEIGSYDLTIGTSHGEATATLMAPLDKLHDSLESRAERLGITVEELKVRLGLSKVVGEEYMSLGLPKVHYVGHTLVVPIKHTAGRTYAWSVNGKPIEIGAGDSAMHYTFTEPGLYDFTYMEMEGDRVVTTGYGATNVVSEPAVRRHLQAGTTANFEAPKGFSHYEWKVNGKTMSGGEVLSYKFEQPGEHKVELHAHTPIAGTVEKFREVTYLINVS